LRTLRTGPLGSGRGYSLEYAGCVWFDNIPCWILWTRYRLRRRCDYKYLGLCVL